MINFSVVSYKSAFGKLLRLPLKLIPKNAVFPILQGRLRGKKWMAHSSNHGCWLGWYEQNIQRAFVGAISEGSAVYDIGANVGFYTLLSAELVGVKGKVIAFEPVPRNLYFLKKHIELNNYTNVTVIESAVSDRNGSAFFDESISSSMGYLNENGQIKVETASLDELVSKKKIPPPDYIKMDIEGGEFDALRGAKSTLATYRPVIFLAVHGRELHTMCCEFLANLGYRLQSITEKNFEDANSIMACPARNRNGAT